MTELLELAQATSQFGINPDDEEELIIDDSVALEMRPLSEADNYIHFISVRALNPGKKQGSTAMSKVLHLVDKNKITLVGRIIPYHTKILSKENLRMWYRKMGCTPADPSDEDGLWVRAPGGGHEDINIGSIAKYKVLNGLSDDDYLERKTLFGALLTISLIFLFIKLR